MKVVYHICIVSFTAISSLAQSYTCLPNDVKPDDVVGVRAFTTRTGQQITEKTTVAQALKKLRARCACGKLVDVQRRQVRFFRLQGCWGNPPDDYSQILDRQRNEIEELKKRYTVIEMTCNPGGVPPA